MTESETTVTEQAMDLGSITITRFIDEGGDIVTGVSVDGDIPIITQLVLIRMAEDTILRGTDE